MKIIGSSEVAQQLRVPASHVEDLSLLPKKCQEIHNKQPVTSNLGVLKASGLRGTHTHTQTYKLK